MSLLTRCPACTTLYKVVPDQLRISQGWVKCGQCGEIFDATQHLMEASTEPEDAMAETASHSAVMLPDATSGSLPQADEDDLDRTPLPYDFAEPEPEPKEEEPEEEEEANSNLGESTGVDRLDEGALGSHDDSTSKALESELQPPTSVMPETQLSHPGVEPQFEAQQEPDALAQAAIQDTPLPLSFMQDAGPSSVWHHPRARGVWGGLVVLLVLGLAGQWVYQDHDRLAASRPQWLPALEVVCGALHCSMGPLQQIESIAIDSAAFSQIASGHYRLSFTLKNSAHLMLALPSVELTLTDIQDRVVVRRVLSSQELAATSDHLAANAEWPVLVDLRLQTDVSAPAVVGYRLLAFYP